MTASNLLSTTAPSFSAIEDILAPGGSSSSGNGQWNYSYPTSPVSPAAAPTSENSGAMGQASQAPGSTAFSPSTKLSVPAGDQASGSGSSSTLEASSTGVALASPTTTPTADLSLTSAAPGTTTTNPRIGSDPLLQVNPTNLAITAVSSDGNTTVGFKMVTAATQAVASKLVMINGQIGPTIAARFYAMAGTSLYEAWHLFSSNDKSSLQGVKSSAMSDLEKTARQMLNGLNPAEREGFIQNVMAETTFKVLRNEVALNTIEVTKVDAATKLFADARDAAMVPLGAGKGRWKDLKAACATLSDQLSQVIGNCFSKDGATTKIAYTPFNSNLDNITDIERWTPEYNKGSLDAGTSQLSGIQAFLTPQWGQVSNLLSADAISGLVNNIPEPAAFLLNANASYDLKNKTITHNGVTQVISKDLIGTLINPAFVQQALDVVNTSANLTPTQKLIAEFWEDGGGTPFPPGTWMEFGKYASEKYNLSTEMDAKLFFGLGQTLLSSSVACWNAKLQYDYTRPLAAIRELGKLGLIGTIDPLTGRSQVQAYNRATQSTGTIFADEWQTFQTVGAGYTPPFPEYTSGHSTFSASAATVIERITGRSDFGATISASSVIENNVPGNPILDLGWKTWMDAALEAGQSRLYGGIHFDSGNLSGRDMGMAIGSQVFNQIQTLWG